MQSYQINELERLSGIKSHTIRIWEKRYELIKPYRTTTNRRYYDDSHVRKLLNVTTLLSQGYKISRIAALSEVEINDKVLLAATGKQDVNLKHINGLIKSMLAFDEHTFDRIMATIEQDYGMYEAMIKVVYPFLVKTAILWKTNKAAPVQEHFASNIIRRKLLSAVDAMDIAAPDKRTFLLFLPSNEWHELGILFADYILRSHGCKTIYLGQNVPLDNINKVTLDLLPDYLFTFFVAARPREEVEAEIQKMIKGNPRSQILISVNGEIGMLSQSVSDKVTYLFNVDDLLVFLANEKKAYPGKI
jgi:DNA-binding transcriptional MerR regulator/methylmalonyl-CoA mutase cobalamin-binding subunit